MSRSVMMPTSRSPSQTGIDPMSRWRMRFAASCRLAPGSMVTTGFMISAIRISVSSSRSEEQRARANATCRLAASVAAGLTRVPSLLACPFVSPDPAKPGAGSSRMAGGLIAGAAVLAVAFVAAGVRAELVPCRRGGDAGRIAEALNRIQRSIDPWGEPPEIARVLDDLRRCTRARYEICIDAAASRNLFERPGEDGFGTITWNPELRSELEDGCGSDPAGHVMRDPVASLVHEIVHAAHDCAGLDAGAYELEAVRVENIYRRAAGLCPRSEERRVGEGWRCWVG